jgi:hypothetical protein
MFHPVQELQFNARARGPIQGSGGANREQLLASLCQCRPTRLRSPNVPGNAFAGHIAHTLCYGERAGSRRGQFAFVATRHAARRDTATARRMFVPLACRSLEWSWSRDASGWSAHTRATRSAHAQPWIPDRRATRASRRRQTTPARPTASR